MFILIGPPSWWAYGPAWWPCVTSGFLGLLCAIYAIKREPQDSGGFLCQHGWHRWNSLMPWMYEYGALVGEQRECRYCQTKEYLIHSGLNGSTILVSEFHFECIQNSLGDIHEMMRDR